MIVKTEFGFHLDLSKVIAISDAHNDMALLTCGVGFSIEVQLRDQPITYREAAPTCDRFGLEATPESIAALQVKIDRLIEQWKQSTGQGACMQPRPTRPGETTQIRNQQ